MVEEALIGSSHERKYLAFSLFETLLPYMEGGRAAGLFSRGFVQCLVNNLRKGDNYLHKRAHACAHTIVQYCQVRTQRRTERTQRRTERTQRRTERTQ